MKRLFFIISIISIFTLFSVNSAAYSAYNADLPEDLQVEDEQDPVLPNIFIWQIPDDNLIPAEHVSDNSEEENDNETEAENTPSEEELYLTNYDNVPVKGYLEFIEDSEAISLKKDDKDFELNLSIPQKFSTSSLNKSDLIKVPTTTFSQNVLSRSSEDIRYNIAPLDRDTGVKYGPFSMGTAYNESIDHADLGFTTSFYTKYETKYFALKTSFDKSAGVAYSMVVDEFKFAPELKLNEYISIKDVISSDITRNRKKNEVILSIRPKKQDHLRFEFGAGQTFDANSELIKSQLKFSTEFKW